MAIRTLWRYVIGRAKVIIKNYNVLERTEKVMEREKRDVAPRHPGTEAKFKVLVKGIPDLKPQLENKPVELLDRLKTVKVSSDVSEEVQKSKRPLPQDREPLEIPIYGFHEPKHIPEGKCSIRRALEFISNHQNDPNSYSAESIAKTYKMNPKDVENILSNFLVFQLYMSREGGGVAKSVMEHLGVNKVTAPAVKSKFVDLHPETSSYGKKYE